MSFNQVMFYVGCALAWFVLLPVCLLAGGIALLSYAVFSEVGEFIAGDAETDVDCSTAREIARRMCLGN